MLTASSLKKIAWAFLPIAIAFVLIGIILLTDFKGAAVVARIKIETLILSFAMIISAVLFSIVFLKIQATNIRTVVEGEQREKSREEHQRFIQRLDHELKNPLTAIQLGLENIEHDPDPAKQVDKSSISELQTQTRRLTQLTGDLRKLAAFDEQSLELEQVNIADLLTETKELVSDLSAHRQIHLNLPAAPWPVPNILADRDLLQLALYNIIENAIKYSDENDRIEVRASDDQEWVKIEISDTGLGIAQNDVDKVWEELYRGSNGRHRKGTGIGLSLVRRIIERHNGKIQLESKENMGTRVTLSLPTSD